MRMNTKTGLMVAAGLALAAGSGAAVAQPVAGEDAAAPRANSASDLLRLMREQGYKVPGELSAGADGTVAVPARPDPNAHDPNDIWDHRIEFSLSLTQGNTENTALRFAYDATREVPTSELTIDASYFFAQGDSETTDNQATAGVTHDWILEDSKWIPFATFRYDWDDFQSWEHRVQLAGGAGYRFYKSDKQEFIGRIGVNLTKEFGSSRNEFIPEALLGFDYRVNFTENQSGEAIFRYYPSMLDFTEFRLTLNTGYRLSMDDVLEGLGFSAGFELEHQSEVDPGIEQNDILLYAGLTLDF
jgi:putative salt-induced outer membrane protein YdiY